ncbi:PAS domain-containing sensor histidine kinase [Nisaea acidiphila]|uniref:histidine kinase n=1 Tax=Nisaea acidiphila TaxID=1862145 RepID=A0A9J7AUN9_9PROT|nr:PAS domain-containing sensor histidine kinase [Nisaea acidiphila]UUX51039.1 PAS domain-containing sensor histidine kinase [Nisaea acidiphila]
MNHNDLPIPIDAVPDALVVFDSEGIIRGANRLLGQLLGYKSSDLIGQQVEMLFPDADRAAHSSIRQSLLKRPPEASPTLHREVFARLRQGTLIPIELSMMRVPTEVGTMFTASMRDSSRHVEIEKALTEAVDEADAANVAKSRFLGTMSHELRTPLNAIIGFSEMIQHETLGPMPHAKYADYVKTIGVSARHLLDLINELIDLSLIEDNSLRLKLERCDLKEILRECRSVIEPRAAAEKLKIRLLLPKEKVHHPVDQQRLRQVLLNLLSNAVKFTDAGGTITLALWKDATGVRVQVVDTGTGIAPAVLANIFELYVRSEAKRNVSAGGLGIGLHVSKRLTEAMGGTIGVESELGHGTTVTLSFPPTTALPANER